MTSWDELQAQVHPGEGLVARTPAGLLVAPAVAATQEDAIERVLGLLSGASAGSGRAVARKLAAIIASSDPDEVPDLALVAAMGGDSLAVLVVGDVEVAAATAGGEERLSGRNSLTWVDRVLTGVSELSVTASGGATSAVGRLIDLVEGVVPGAGISLVPRQAAAPARTPARPRRRTQPEQEQPQQEPPQQLVGGPVDEPETESMAETGESAVSVAKPARKRGTEKAGAAVSSGGGPSPAGPIVVDEPHSRPERNQPGQDVPSQRDEPFDSVSLMDAEPEPEPRAPLPVDPGLIPPPPHQTGLIEGIYCKRGHFTDPDGQFCIVCGIGLYETRVKQKGPRPELGFLVFDDGSVFHLDHDYVLGRQPEVDPDVKSGTMRGLRLDDAGGTVSRAHAIVRLVGWNVTLADRRSQNGTYVAAKGSEQFVPVSRDNPVTLVPGSRIRLGHRTLVYESHRGRTG